MDLTLIALLLCRSTTPAVAVMLVLLPEPLTQWAAVRTTCGVISEPPQPMESRIIQGNSPWAARTPPTTGAGAAEAEVVGWRLTAARTTAPAAASFWSARTIRFCFTCLPSLMGGCLDRR